MKNEKDEMFVLKKALNNYLKTHLENAKKNDLSYNYLLGLKSIFLYETTEITHRFIFLSIFFQVLFMNIDINNYINIVLVAHNLPQLHSITPLLSVLSGLFLSIFLGIKPRKLLILKSSMFLKMSVLNEELSKKDINGFYRLLKDKKLRDSFIFYIENQERVNLSTIYSFSRLKRY